MIQLILLGLAVVCVILAGKALLGGEVGSRWYVRLLARTKLFLDTGQANGHSA